MSVKAKERLKKGSVSSVDNDSDVYSEPGSLEEDLSDISLESEDDGEEWIQKVETPNSPSKAKPKSPTADEYEYDSSDEEVCL